MYGYEGLGCIYWHMVSKLLLAVQECFWQAIRDGQPADVIDQLARSYYRVREGLSFNKTAASYGAFPVDPYSHTPAHSGAQQPGMTGQVKEEILTRLGELGVSVNDGKIHINPRLLRRNEFLSHGKTWTWISKDGKPQEVELPAGTLAFTLCQTPVIYRLVQTKGSLTIVNSDRTQTVTSELTITQPTSADIFARNGRVERIDVSIPAVVLLAD